MRKHKKNGKIYKLAVILMIGVSLYLLCSQYLVKNVERQLFAQSKSYVTSSTILAVNTATHETIKENLNYGDYVTVEKDNENNITFIQCKAMQINKLSRELALNCTKHITNVGAHTMHIPWGAFTGFVLFANCGKKIDIPLTINYDVIADYFSTFIAVGINQTRHSVYIKIHINMDIVLPLYNFPLGIDQCILVTENVIVGKIPEVYINATDYAEYFDLIPND